VEEKPDDDEIPDYITELNIVIAKQENSSSPGIISKKLINSQSKSLLKSANLKIAYCFLLPQINQSKIFYNNLCGGSMAKLQALSILGFLVLGCHGPFPQ